MGQTMKLKFRLPFVIEKQNKNFTEVSCFGCAHKFYLTKNNLRAVNYCWECK